VQTRGDFIFTLAVQAPMRASLGDAAGFGKGKILSATHTRPPIANKTFDKQKISGRIRQWMVGRIGLRTYRIVLGIGLIMDAALGFRATDTWRNCRMNIYVGNLSFSVTDGDLQEAFEAHGAVDRAKVILDRETGRSRGFGFVEMTSDNEGNAAIEAMNEIGRAHV